MDIRHYHLIHFFLYQSFFQAIFIFFHDLLILLSINFNDFLLALLSNDERNLSFNKGRHDKCQFEKFAVLAVAEKGGEMAKLDASHQFIKAHSSILSHQHIFCEVCAWKLHLQELDELFEHLSVHFVSHLHSKWPLCV